MMWTSCAAPLFASFALLLALSPMSAASLQPVAFTKKAVLSSSRVAAGASAPSSPIISSTTALAVTGGGAADTEVSLLNSPAVAYHMGAAKGYAASKMSVAKTLVAAILGGAYVGVGGMLSLAIAGNLAAGTAPGVVKFTFAALFPVALFLCLQGGAQLFTGNTASMMSAWFEKKVSLMDVLRNWVLAYAGNFIGCAGFAWLCSYCGVLSGGSASMAANMLTAKTSSAVGPILVKAILCNWLVCLAVYCATQAKDMMGKYIGIFLPISAFVCIGFEHSVANMFLLPAGLLTTTGDISLKTVLLKNLLPVTIGNAIAGSVLIAAGFSFLFGRLGEGK